VRRTTLALLIAAAVAVLAIFASRFESRDAGIAAYEATMTRVCDAMAEAHARTFARATGVDPPERKRSFRDWYGMGATLHFEGPEEHDCDGICSFDDNDFVVEMATSRTAATSTFGVFAHAWTSEITEAHRPPILHAVVRATWSWRLLHVSPRIEVELGGLASDDAFATDLAAGLAARGLSCRILPAPPEN
jgi:hypothetical protein